MKLRHIALALGLATASAGAAFAQTAIVVDPAVRADPNAPVVIVTPNDAVVLSPDNTSDLPTGQHYSVDRFGHRIIVDDAYDPARPDHRSIFDSSIDRATGTVTSPGYMGPRDTTGQ
ncbi:MAG: hypothetical protein U1F54_02425 [Burkholderiales bacterium]